MNSNTTMLRRIMRSTVSAAAVATVLVSLAACAPTTSQKDQTESSRPYVEPGWMADIRQEAEEQSQAIANCLRDEGWDVTVLPDNGLTFAKSGQKLRKKRAEATGQCYTQVAGHKGYPSESELRELYKKALDTRDCLEDAGYDIPDPPSEDAWVAAMQKDETAWTPFSLLIDQVFSGKVRLSQDEYYELYGRCPQAGPIAQMSR